MLECARVKGPCSVKTVPDPPPCPPPPPPPFPWIYVWSLASFFGIMGLIYKFYLWNQDRLSQGENVPIWRPRRIIKRPYHEQDLPPCVQYLIIGAGAAGWAAYRAIMEHDKKAKVFFISKEDCLPYRRPPMSKHMWWNPEPPDIKNLYYVESWKKKTMYESECHKFMDPVKFYRQKSGPAVSIATGWCVIRVDADDHVAYVKTLCGEQPIYYERCLIAPGSKPKLLSMFKSAPKPVRDRVCTLRTIRDLEVAYRSVKSAKHVVVIGGGPLGCELAWHLGRMNKLDKELDPDKEPIKIIHLYKDKGIMAGVLPEYLGEWAAEKIKNEGVVVKPKTQVYDAYQSSDGRLELTLSDGSSIVTDYAFVAVGAEPRVELAKPSFLEVDEVNGGFLVNTELEARTHLYVAGDAASLYSQWKDTRLRMDHYLNAVEQGYVAGANMTGYWAASNMEPHYWLKLEDELQMEVVGEVGACMPTIGIFKQCASDEAAKQTQAAESGGGDRPCYKRTEEYKNRYLRGMLMYMRDDTVVGFVFWNMPPIEDRSAVATEILRAKPSYKDIDTLADLLGFVGTKCIYREDEKLIEPGPCIKKSRSPVSKKIGGDTRTDRRKKDLISKKKKIKCHDMVFDNTSRDAVPKRGYYSELVSDMMKEEPSREMCAKKRMKLILQQFPFETFVPKLQFLSVVLPKEMPRLVKIERLRRKFLSANIKKMLRELGIQPYWLIPPSEYPISDTTRYGLYSPYPKLDLEIFDNTDFDCREENADDSNDITRIPEEWLALGDIDGERHPCPGLAFVPKEEGSNRPVVDVIQMLNNLYEWTNVAIFSYDKRTDKWEVMTLDGLKRRFNIPRIRLMFKADDPETFAQRVKFAVDLRDEVENNLRFYLYLDCLILHGLPRMPLHYMPKILKMVRIHKQAKELDEGHLAELKMEAELLYRKMEGKMKMIYMIQKYPNMYNFIRAPSKEKEPPVPEYGRLPCDMEDFVGRVKYNQWYSLYVLTESISCIHLVVEECLKYALRHCIEQSMQMFVTLCETPCLCTYVCEDDYVWDSSDLINSPFRSHAPTLFYFHLMMNENGPYYTTPPEQFEVR
ncbi:unnamed protein product, partial [Iphiclides podalirius]